MQQNSLAFFQPSDALMPPVNPIRDYRGVLSNLENKDSFNQSVYALPYTTRGTFLPFGRNERGIGLAVPQFLIDMYDQTFGATGKALSGELGIPSVNNPVFTQAGRNMALNTTFGGLLSSAVPKALPVGSLGMSGGNFKTPKITAEDIKVTDNLPIFGSKDFPAENLLGKRIVPFPADLMDAGRFYTGLDDIAITPVPLQGGSLYPLMKQSRDKGLVFANLDLKKAMKPYNLDAEFAVPLAMNPQSPRKLPSQFSNKTMGRIVGLQTLKYIEKGVIKPEDVGKLNQLIRSKGKNVGSEGLADFVGFDSPKVLQWINDLPFDQRIKFAEAMNTKEAKGFNVPNLDRIAQKTINPAEAGLSAMDTTILYKLSGEKPVKVSDIGGVPHLSYDFAVLGEPVARFDAPVNARSIFPDFFKERRLLGKRESDDQRSMDFRNVVQIGTPEITTKMTVKKIGNINSPRHAQLLTDTVNSNWRDTQTAVTKGGLGSAEVVDAFDANILSESLTKYSLKEIQQGAKDGSLVFYGLGDKKTGGKVYFGLKKNTDYEADYGFTHPELTKNETAIVGVMNNELGYASKGLAVPSSILKGVENGATVLDAYAVRSKEYPDGFLPSYYSEFGFKELGSVKFDPKYVRDPEFGGSEQKYRKLLAQWRNQGWNEKYGFPDLVIMKWQGIDAVRKNATRRFLEEGTQFFRNRQTKRTVGTARNLSGQSTTGSVGKTQQSGRKGDQGGDSGQIQTGNRVPVSEGFRRNIQSLTGASPEQLRAYGLLT